MKGNVANGDGCHGSVTWRVNFKSRPNPRFHPPPVIRIVIFPPVIEALHSPPTPHPPLPLPSTHTVQQLASLFLLSLSSLSPFPAAVALTLTAFQGSAMKGGKPKADTAKKADSKLSVKRKGTDRVNKKPAKKEKAGKDPNKPKRPPSAFFVFMEEFRKQFKEKNPNNKSVAVVGKAGGDKWKTLSDAEKAPYVAKAEKRKTEYNKTMAAYNKKKDSASAAADDDEEGSDKSKSEVNDGEDEESGEEGDEDDDDE